MTASKESEGKPIDVEFTEYDTADFYSADPEAESYEHTTPEAAIMARLAPYVEQENCDAALPIRVVAYRRVVVPDVWMQALALELAERAIEAFEDEYGDPEGGTVNAYTKAHLITECDEVVRTLVGSSTVWQCEPCGERTYSPAEVTFFLLRKERFASGSKGHPTRTLPTLEECEKAIGLRATEWVARCYEISGRIVQAGLVEGAAVYGHWLGPVHRKSYFARRRGLPFVRHGWIVLEDGRVLDPTRWVFEAKEPYLFVGEPSEAGEDPCVHCGLIEADHDDASCDVYEPTPWPYDEGGNQWRAARGRPAPIPNPDEPLLTFNVTALSEQFVAALFGQADGSKLTQNQIFWLANQPYQTFAGVCGRVVKEIYRAIYQAGFGAFIPLDNVTRAQREFGFDPHAVNRGG